MKILTIICCSLVMVSGWGRLTGYDPMWHAFCLPRAASTAIFGILVVGTLWTPSRAIRTGRNAEQLQWLSLLLVCPFFLCGGLFVGLMCMGASSKDLRVLAAPLATLLLPVAGLVKNFSRLDGQIPVGKYQSLVAALGSIVTGCTVRVVTVLAETRGIKVRDDLAQLLEVELLLAVPLLLVLNVVGGRFSRDSSQV